MNKRLLGALVLGLSLALGLIWLLGADLLPVARAASLIVNTTDDELNSDGDCSLREAIQAANTDAAVDGCTAGSGDDIITLPIGTYTLTRSGSGEDANQTGDLDVTDALTIIGAGLDQTVIDANSIDRVFDIRNGASTVVISGVAIINGNIFDNGGGIRNNGADLTLVNTAVTGNTSNHLYGGGVYVNQGSVTLSGGQIANNTTTGSGGGVYIYEGSVTLSSGQIVSNTASSYGGGVYVRQSAAAFTQTGGASMIANNIASSGGGVYVYEGSAVLSGGQVFSNAAGSGGGVYVNQGSAVLSGGQIVSNTASSHGGGVYVRWSTAAFTQTGGTSAIAGNTADQKGGGVYISYGSAVLSGGRIVSNTANYGGGVYVDYTGAIFIQTGRSGTIISNTANYHGGGVYVNQGSATLSAGQIVNNIAFSHGGGLYNNVGSLSLINSTLSGNRAGSDGGGLYNFDGTSAITYTTIASNTALTGGSTIYRSSGAVTLLDTIVAYNGVTNCIGTITSNGHNLEDTDTCGLNASGDITDTDPLLGPLSDEGGTLVHPLLPASPAIDAGICVAGITIDQRGVPRLQGNDCDIGAYELKPVQPSGVQIVGPVEGAVDKQYVFTANVTPPTVTSPLTYTWSPEPDGGQRTPVVTYTWSAAGSQTISVTVVNVAGSATDTHTIEVEHWTYLPLVLRN